MYGVYDTGPWLGIKMRGNDFVGWIGGGTRTFDLMVGEYDNSPCQFSVQVWRHTCLSLHRTTGRFKLVENGIKIVEKESEDIVEWMKNVSFEVERNDYALY